MRWAGLLLDELGLLSLLGSLLVQVNWGHRWHPAYLVGPLAIMLTANILLGKWIFIVVFAVLLAAQLAAWRWGSRIVPRWAIRR